MATLKGNPSIIDLTLDDDDDNNDSTRVRGQNNIEITDVTNLSSSVTRKRKKRAANSSNTTFDYNVIVIEDSDDEKPSSSSTLKSNVKRRRPLSPYNAVASSSKMVAIEVTTASIKVDARDKRQSTPDAGSSRQDEPLFHPEDIELAKRLAEEERQEYRELMQRIEGRKEGIVFRVVVNADGTLEDGTPAHSDDIARFQPWRQNFEAGGQRVKRFHWIVNYELEKRFEAARDELRNLLGEEPEEIRLWHGTAAANIDSILTGGFRIGGMNGHPVKNGAALGHGIYLAKDGMTSVGYAVGADRIFGCRVLPGRTTNDMGISKRLPPSTELGHERYHSYTFGGPVGLGNHVYVVRYSCLVLPCYMIEYETRYPGLGAPMAPMPLPFPGPFGRAVPGPFTGAFPAAGPAFNRALPMPPMPAAPPLLPGGPALNRAMFPIPPLPAMPPIPPMFGAANLGPAVPSLPPAVTSTRKTAPRSRKRVQTTVGNASDGALAGGVRATNSRSRRQVQDSDGNGDDGDYIAGM
ncbi:hypothetical protein VKT23_006101 [Stygiomarasmius scandens]|uniref:PARP catalytic domain-containing protein n=1 Tax=Marasmiellus scandens TaxID=2682957 RepID=A0ABR1JQ15_9AGAR